MLLMVRRPSEPVVESEKRKRGALQIISMWGVDCLPTDLLCVDAIEATARGNPGGPLASAALRAVAHVHNSSPYPWSRLRSRSAACCVVAAKRW
ncbi:MAG: hypothetical protein QOD10_1043 [Mycobacterium sp.]|jgi:hypothetical protein|nr:hypothetical protein [Mycobacterium sp.]